MAGAEIVSVPHWSSTLLADEQTTIREIDGEHQLRRSITLSLASAAAGAMGFGVSLGIYARSFPQTLSSAIKMPLLLLGTAAICFPAFFVLQRLRAPRPLSLAQALALQANSLSAVGLVWASLAPPILLLVGTSYHYVLAQFLAVAVGTIGGLAGLRRLRAGCMALVTGADSKTRTGFLLIYGLLFSCVGAQLSWVLRPFIGSPSLQFQLFRPLAGSFFAHLFHMVR